MNRGRALDYYWSMIFSEGRFPLFRIMLAYYWSMIPRLEPEGMSSEDRLPQWNEGVIFSSFQCGTDE
jgi:hypothetical protein